MALKDICLPKQEEGLGIICTKEWNKVAMIRYLWNMACRKKDCI